MSEQNRYRSNATQRGPNRDRGAESPWQRDYGQRSDYGQRWDYQRPEFGPREYGPPDQVQRARRFESAGRMGPDYSRESSIERDLRDNDYPRDSGYARDDRFLLDFGPNDEREYRTPEPEYREFRGPSGYGRGGDFRPGPLQHLDNFGSRTRAEAARPAGLQAASHYGRGPKGYVRSDERIREEVCERLSDNDQVDASDIAVFVRDREVTLEGSVETRRMKHLSEDIADSVSGVEDVHNRLTVRKAFLKDVADRVLGNEPHEHYAHSGTRDTAGTSNFTGNNTANGHS